MYRAPTGYISHVSSASHNLRNKKVINMCHEPSVLYLSKRSKENSYFLFYLSHVSLTFFILFFFS